MTVQSPAVEALIDRCMTALAMSDYLFRDEWPDVGKTAREKIRERVLTVLEATGVRLEVLAAVADGVGDQGAVVEYRPQMQQSAATSWAKRWWRAKS